MPTTSTALRCRGSAIRVRLHCKLAVLLTLANVDLEGDHPISSNNCREGDGPCCVSDDDLRVQLATHLVEARLAVDEARRFSPGLPCTEDYVAASAELTSFVTATAAGTASFAGVRPSSRRSSERARCRPTSS